MPKKLAIVLQSDGALQTRAAGEFNDSDHGMLLAFSGEYSRLCASELFQRGMPCHMTMSGERGKPIQIQTRLPTDDDLSLFLHRLRPFILEKEPASFVKTLSCLGKNIDNAAFREFLRTIRELYDGGEFQAQSRIASDGMLLNCERIVFEWLNAYEYHRVPDYQAKIRSIVDNTPGDLVKFIVVSMLVDKFNAIQRLAALVSVLLGATKTVRFAASNPES